MSSDARIKNLYTYLLSDRRPRVVGSLVDYLDIAVRAMVHCGAAGKFTSPFENGNR